MRFAAALLVWVSLSSGALGQPPPETRPRDEQTLFFRAVLRELGAQPITDFDALSHSPDKKVLIALGPTNVLNGLATGGKLRRFLTEGGAVLIASDQGMSRNLSNQTGAVIDGRLYTGRHDDVYRDNLIECPLLHEVRRKERPTEPHPIFRDMPSNAVIATNRPSLLFDWNRGDNYRQIAVIGAPLATDLRGPTIQGYRTFGVVGEFPKGGRLLVLADHSIFIDMMVQPDNHNLDFAFGALRWLTEDGKRTEVLMIDNDTIQTNFNVSLVRPPMPPMPSIQDLLPIISQGISEFQREDRINKMIQRAVPHSTLMRNTVLILTLVLLAAGSYCFLHSRHRNDSRPRPAAPTGESSGPMVSSYADSARELATEVFREFNPTPLASVDPPRAIIRGSERDRRDWQAQIQKLWSIARGADAPNSAASLQRVHVDCQAVRTAIAAGVVQFAVKS